MPQNHQINKQRIVISTPGKGTGQISDEIQKAKEQTSRRIENLFDQHIPADRLVEINSLHLDLGLLPTTNFIAEYQRRLTLLLENELRKLSRSPGFEKYVQTLPVLLSDRYERAVRYFLQGYEPGLQGEPGFEITAVVKQLLEQDSRRLATALEKVWQSEIATLRAQRQLAPTIYRKIESLRVTDSFASQPVAEKLPGKEISQALEQYFVKGTFPAWFKPASLLSVEQYFFKIEGAALRKLAIKVERMLTKTEVRKRLAETLSTDSLKKVFFVLPELQKPLQELEILEAALTKEAVRSAFFQAVEFKEILLRYIAARNESEKLKARILLELIQQSGGKQELLKGFLKDKNVRNSYFKRLLTNPRKTAKILQEKRTPKPSPGNMGILLRYLENGILTAGLDFTTLLSKMLVSHSVLLRKTLQDNWHLYPVRYRLAYQTDEKQLIELMELLFSEVEGFQRFETLFDEEPSFATSTRRHLYFAFFNLMAHSTNKGFTQKSFNEKFVLELSALFPELKMDLGELAHLGGGHPAKLGRHLLKAVDENSDVQEEIKPVRETLEEFVLKGSSSEAYQKLAGKKRLLLFFDEVIAGKELTASMLLQKRVHRTFWSEIVTTLKAGQLMELTAQLILFQANAWNGIRLELMRLEIELGLKPKTLYPLKRKGMFLILQTLASGNFALSEKQFAEFYFQKAWDQLKSKSGTSTHQNLLNRLWIKSAHPEFQYRLPLTYNWLRGIDPLAGARKNRLQELKQGISDPFWDKYTSIDLVKFYLQKSALPSWSSLKNKKEVSAILEQLVENQNPKLARMAVAIQKEYVQLRLINMLKPESFYRFLNYLDPERYATFSLVIDDLKSKASPFSKVPIKVFELFLQLQLFNLLGSPRAMQDGEAVQDLLQSASLKYNLAYAKLVAGLHKGLKSLKSNILKVVVQREYSALQKPEARAWRKSTTTGQTREGSASADVLKHYFLKGDIPQWSTTKGKNELAKLIGQGLKSNPSEVMEILHSLKKKRQGLARFMELLRLADFERIFGLLAKGRKESFKKTVDDLLRFQKLVKNLDAGGLDFKRTLYAALLKFLVEEETGFYQDKKLAASLVKAISVKYGVNHLTLIHQLQLRYNHFESTSLKSYLRDFTTEDTAGKKANNWLREGILHKYRYEYSTTHLILYYLKTLRFPEWGAVKSRTALAALFKKGIDIAPIEIVEILRGLKDDPNARLALAKLINGKTLTEALQLLDTRQLKRYKPITDDFLKTRAIAPFSHLKTGELRPFLNFLLLTVMVVDQPARPSEEFARYLLEELSRKFSFDKNEWLETVGQKQVIFKNKVLQKVIADYKMSVPTKTAKEVGVAVLTNEIDTFLYIISHQKLPWWRMGGNEKSTVAAEKKRLYKLIFTGHLPELMKSLRESDREDFYLEQVFAGIPFKEFHRIISAVAPNVAGFIRMYTRALEGMSKERYSSVSFKGHPKVYVKIYRHVGLLSGHFSAVDFARRMTFFLSSHLDVDYQIFIHGLIDESEKLFKKGELQFKILTQVLEGLQQAGDGKRVQLDEPPVKEILHEKAELDFTEIFAHYLRHGSLPAGVAIGSYRELVTKFKALTLSEPIKLRLALESALGKPVAGQRLQLHGDPFLIQLAAFTLNTTAGKIETWLKGMMDFLIFTNRKVSKPAFQSVIWEVLLNYLSHGSSRFKSETLIQWVFKRVSATSLIPHFSQNISNYFSSYEAGPGIGSEFKMALNKAVEATPEKQWANVRKIPEEKQQPLEGQLEIHNSGMVILANYLPRYFEMLKMTEKRAFKDEETAARAVHLIQYLVSGQTETPEHELILNKVFCGLDLAYPVELSIALSDEEKDVSESLLKGVLQNWDRMKSNSIESLREGFLMRNGYLREAPHERELEVEQSGKDILLDYLPWSFSMIKLPWMAKGVNVKWRNKKPNP